MGTPFILGTPIEGKLFQCRAKLENKLKETEEGQTRLADAEQRMEEGKTKKAGVVLEQTGLPDPQDGEVMSPVALGQPEEDQGSPKRGQEGERKEASKKARSAPSQREKRKPETGLDDLYREDVGEEPVVVHAGPPAASAGVTASGSAAPGASMSHDQFWSAVEAPPGTVPASTPASATDAVQDIQTLFHIGVEFGEERQVSARDLRALGAHDVMEVFSPPRLTERCKAFGLLPGYAIDLETGWDLLDDAQVKSLERVLDEEDPFLLTGSPPYEAFSPLQGLNKDRVGPLVREERLRIGRQNLKTTCDMYKRQHRRKRYFLHEHPKPAASWKEDCVKEVMTLPGVVVVEGPMCRWKMTAQDATGEGFVRKQTCWMTNCHTTRSL